MTRRPARRRAGPSPNRHEFPALTAFLRAYLHEDFPEEHGTTRAATIAFRRDATLGERQQLTVEITRLIEAAGTLPVHRLRQFVTQELGCGWEPRSIEDFAEMLSVLRVTT
jgi:hypothetical protein